MLEIKAKNMFLISCQNLTYSNRELRKPQGGALGHKVLIVGMDLYKTPHGREAEKNLEITWTDVAILAGCHRGLILHRKAIGIVSRTRHDIVRRQQRPGVHLAKSSGATRKEDNHEPVSRSSEEVRSV